MDVVDDIAPTEQDETPPDEQPQVQFVPIMAPISYGATPPMQMLPGTNTPVVGKTGPDVPVFIIMKQGGWGIQGEFNQNDALEFANRIKKAVKQARGGLQVARNVLVGADGQALSIPGDADDSEDLDELSDGGE